MVGFLVVDDASNLSKYCLSWLGLELARERTKFRVGEFGLAISLSGTNVILCLTPILQPATTGFKGNTEGLSLHTLKP